MQIMKVKKIITKLQVEYIIKKYHIKIGPYKIRDDGLIDVNGNVKICHTNLKRLPLRFGHVYGNFTCNSKLTTLKGCPTYIAGDFDCSNNLLDNLQFSPKEIGGNFNCQENQIVTLKGSPREVIGRFNCALNKLKSLEFGPEKVGESYYANHNQITSLIGSARYIGRDFHVEANLLHDLTYCPDHIENSFHFDSWIPSLYMGLKNCIVKYVKIERLGKIDNTRRMLPQALVSNIKSLPILFKYHKYLLEIWNIDGSLNEDNFNDFLLDVSEGLR